MNTKKILIGIVFFLVLATITIEVKDLINMKNSHKNIENSIIYGIEIVLRVIRN